MQTIIVHVTHRALRWQKSSALAVCCTVQTTNTSEAEVGDLGAATATSKSKQEETLHGLHGLCGKHQEVVGLPRAPSTAAAAKLTTIGFGYSGGSLHMSRKAAQLSAARIRIRHHEYNTATVEARYKRRFQISNSCRFACDGRLYRCVVYYYYALSYAFTFHKAP